MKAGRELDAKVAEEVMGWEIITLGNTDVWAERLVDGWEPKRQNWNPSTQIADAWLVVEKMKNDWCNLEFMCGRYQAKFKTGARVIEYKYYEAQADTAPLAICLAALKAIE